MKLLNKTTLYFFIPALTLIIACGFIQYELVNSRIIKRVDKQLLKEKKLILKQLKDLKDTDDFSLYKTLKSDIEIKENLMLKPPKDDFYSKEVFDKEDLEDVPFRFLDFSSNIKGQTFIVSIRKPMEETITFIYGLVGANIILFASLIILVVWVNRFSSKKVWEPFYLTLRKLQRFNISDPESVNFTETKIHEFKLLNSELDLLIKKITRDYKTYKNFIENVSHELQTPIAVAKSKLDLVIQSPNLKKEEHHQLGIMSMNLNKLTRLNQSLIMLLKIENNIYSQKERINLVKVINDSFINFEDIIEIKGIKVILNLENDNGILCNELLAETLVDNLLKNAVKHNVQNGYIEVNYANGQLTIINSGEPSNVKPEFLFERFKKDSDSPDSNGLGLSIVHQICKIHGFTVKYKISHDLHSLQVNFH